MIDTYKKTNDYESETLNHNNVVQHRNLVKKRQKWRRTFRRTVRRQRPSGSMRTSSSRSRESGPYESTLKTSWPWESYTVKPSPEKKREVLSTV